uniref:Uncharacterized protein n=1 Tax=Ditylenchus dipsaci TaxID=166011 RepID=A0A915E1Z2_9BILA
MPMQTSPAISTASGSQAPFGYGQPGNNTVMNINLPPSMSNSGQNSNNKMNAPEKVEQMSSDSSSSSSSGDEG